MPTTRSQDAYHSMHIRSTLRDRSMDTVAAVAVLIAVTTLVGVCVLPGRLVVATALRRARSMLTTRSKECLLGGVRSLSVEGSSRVQNPESRVQSPESSSGVRIPCTASPRLLFCNRGGSGTPR